MAQLGNDRRVYIVTGTGTLEYSVLAGEQSNSFNRTSEAIETSDKGSLWATFISGKKGATAEVTVYTDNNDDEQKAVIKGLHQGLDVKVFIGSLTSGQTPAPSEGDVFDAVITAISDTNDNGAVASRSLSLTANGEVTHYPAIV